ncbi:hypothetical protein B0E43_11300 [Algoriphagus sp. A40]|nr:hypothetical protein B0E43_11300 [Algoriphagus sp. A40]
MKEWAKATFQFNWMNSKLGRNGLKPHSYSNGWIMGAGHEKMELARSYWFPESFFNLGLKPR